MESATQSPLPTRVLGGLRQFWAWLPAKYFWLLLIICAVLRDSAFPFSHFPMYSRLSKTANYVYVTDGQDKPVALMPQFAVRAASLSKSFRANLKKVTKKHDVKRKEAGPELYAEAGEITLRHLLREGSLRRPEVPMPEEFKLWYVEIRREGDRLKETPLFAGSIRTADVELPPADPNAAPADDTDSAGEGDDDES